MRWRRTRSGLALLSALLLSLSACADGDGEEPRSTGASSGPDVNAADRADLAPGGSLDWGINDFPAQWNPHHTDGNLTTVATVTGALMPSPFEIGPDDAPRPDPDYVLDAEMDRGEGGQVLTMRLNPDARWSDGTPVTWKDYHATAQALAGGDQGYAVRGDVGYDRIAAVEPGADPYEVVITFDAPFAEYAALFSPLLPESVAEDPERFASAYSEDIPVTAGPFAFAGMDTARQTVTLKRSEEWWGDPAVLDEIVFRAMDADALGTAFLDGGVDAYQLPVDASAYERAAGAEGREVRTAPGPDYRHLTLNGESPFLDDVRVRHAVFLGIDRQAVTDAALTGVDWSGEPLGNHFLETLPGHADNSGEWGEYDPERAAALLEEAGWTDPDGDGVRSKDGKDLELRYLIPRGFAPGQAEAELIQAMLSEVGIGVDIRPVGGDELFSRYVIPGDYDLVAFVNAGGPFPLAFSLPQWVSPMPTGDGPDWRSNVGRIASPEVDAALDDALSSLDPTASVAALNEADRLLWESGHTLPLYQRPQLMATRTDIANLGAPGLRTHDYTDIGFLKKG